MNARSVTRSLALLAAIPIVLSACLGTATTSAPATPAVSAAPASAGAGESGSPASPAADVSGTVTFWHGYAANGDEVKTFDEVVAPLFKEQYPNITLEAQQVPDTELRQKLLTALAAGSPPDVLRADIIWVPEFAEQGALLALDEEMADFDAVTADMYEGPLSTNKWGEHYYGLPLDTNTRVLFYNNAVFEEAGVTAAPTTIDEFEAAMAKVKELGPERFGYAEGGTGPWSVLPWLWAFGGGITDDAVTSATGTLNGAGTVAAVTRLQDWLAKGYISPSILGGGVATSEQFGNNQAAMILEGPWMPNIFKNQFPELTYEYATVPAGPGGTASVVGGEDIVVFEAAKDREAALAFTRFMVSEEVQLAMGKIGQMPVIESLAGHPELPDYYPVFQEQLKTAKARTPVPSWPKIDETVSNAVLKALRGEATVQAALDEAATQVDALLAGS